MSRRAGHSSGASAPAATGTGARDRSGGGPPDSSAGRARRGLIAAGRLGLAAAILAWLFGEFSPARVLEAAGSVAPAALVAAFALALLAHVAVADRLRRVIAALGMRLSTPALLEIGLATMFYGLVLPAGNFTGILARFYKISKREPNYGAIAVGLGFERLVATLTLCLVGIGFWLLDPAAAWPPLALMVAVLAAGVVVHGVLFGGTSPRATWVRVLFGRLLPRRASSLREALANARTLGGRTVAEVFALGGVTHGLGIAAFWVLSVALGLDLSPATAAWTRSAALLVAILPISTAGLGVREGAMMVLLAPYGVSGTDALTYSLLAFATTVLGPAAVGGLLEARRLLR